jgi:hypothetical protein
MLVSSIVYGVTCLSSKFEHFIKLLRVFHIVPGVHPGSHDNVAVALLFNLCLVNGPSPNTGCICFIVVGRTRLYRLTCSIKICIYSNEGNGEHFCDLDGETQPQTQSYCSKSALGLGLAFSIETPHVCPISNKTYTYMMFRVYCTLNVIMCLLLLTIYSINVCTLFN